MPINRLISIIDEQSMLRFFVIVDFIDYQFLSIINANRSVGERIQISNICTYCRMRIHTCWNVWDTKIFNANQWQSMSYDNFCVIIDWSIHRLADGNWCQLLTRHWLSSIDRLIFRSSVLSIVQALVFTTFKLRNLFSVKDPVPRELCSRVIYKFTCACCNACYISETGRHLSTRIHEHLPSDKSSRIFKHLLSSERCHQSCSADCFEILDSTPTKFQL